MTPGRQDVALCAAGALALLATACGSGSGGNTLCSTYMSMNTADQRSTITTMLQQGSGSKPPSDEVSETRLSASAYCEYTIANVDEPISGYVDSRPA